MFKYRRKQKKKRGHCTECSHCLPLGDGDFMCDEWDKFESEPIIVLSDYVATEDYFKCKRHYFGRN